MLRHVFQHLEEMGAAKAFLVRAKKDHAHDSGLALAGAANPYGISQANATFGIRSAAASEVASAGQARS